MIGVEGNYLYKFDIDDRQDFIKSEDLIEFIHVAECGNALPTFSLEFYTQDQQILPYFNEGNVFKVSYGKWNTNLVDVPLRCVGHPKIEKRGNNSYRIFVQGFYDALDYFKASTPYMSSRISGTDVIKGQAKLYFPKVDLNYSTTNDAMVWIRPSTSNKRFISDTWFHLHMPNSFPCVAITSEGIFRLYDMRKKLRGARGNRQDWTLTPDVQKDNDIPYTQSYVIDHEKSFLINQWLGYDRQKLIYDLETGGDSTITESIEPLLTLSDTMNRYAQEEARREVVGVSNSNIHPNYHRACQRNLQHLLTFSSLSLRVAVDDLFYPIEPLDLVLLQDPDIKALGASDEFVSGFFFVSRVCKYIQSYQYSTTINLVREALNFNQGKLY